MNYRVLTGLVGMPLAAWFSLLMMNLHVASSGPALYEIVLVLMGPSAVLSFILPRAFVWIIGVATWVLLPILVSRRKYWFVFLSLWVILGLLASSLFVFLVYRIT